MVNLEVDDPGREEQSKRDVEEMSLCDNDPSLVKLLAFLLRRTTGRAIVDTLEGSSRLLGSSQLNQVGGEKMARDEKVKEKSQVNILTTVIMTPHADQDTVL